VAIHWPFSTQRHSISNTLLVPFRVATKTAPSSRRAKPCGDPLALFSAKAPHIQCTTCALQSSHKNHAVIAKGEALWRSIALFSAKALHIQCTTYALQGSHKAMPSSRRAKPCGDPLTLFSAKALHIQCTTCVLQGSHKNHAVIAKGEALWRSIGPFQREGSPYPIHYLCPLE